jgi:hypothetical protein
MRFFIALTLTGLYSCASLEPDYVGWVKKYPDCWHEKYAVIKRCHDMNEAGDKVTALRVDQLLRDGKIQ